MSSKLSLSTAPTLPSDGKITNLTLNFRPEAFLFIALPTQTQTHWEPESRHWLAIERWPGSTAVIRAMTHIRLQMLYPMQLQSTEVRRWAASITIQIMPPPTLFRLRWQHTDQGQPSRLWFLFVEDNNSHWEWNLPQGSYTVVLDWFNHGYTGKKYICNNV